MFFGVVTSSTKTENLLNILNIWFQTENTTSSSFYVPQSSLVFPAAFVPQRQRKGVPSSSLSYKHQAMPSSERAFRQNLHKLLKYNWRQHLLQPCLWVKKNSKSRERNTSTIQSLNIAHAKPWYKRRNIKCFSVLWCSRKGMGFNQQLQAEKADLNGFKYF